MKSESEAEERLRNIRVQEFREYVGDCMDSAWQQLIKRCKETEPPEENMPMQCIQICPRDIRWMQQKNCPVSCNQFLMRGFYGYRYLLLARTEEGSYLLGVPGGFQPQEACLAEAFGFPEFLRNAKGGKAEGYWCRRIAR